VTTGQGRQDRAALAAWRLAVGSFTLAALTGAFMRFGMYLGLPWGLQLGDVRHAHSHLMFFSWATPALALAAHAALRQSGRRLPGGAAVAGAAALAGLLAYVPFLLSGYRLLPLGDAELPLSMMASGLNGVVWYALAGLWLAGSWRARRTVAMRLMDGAVAMLLASTFGVLLLMVEGIGGTATPAGVAANADFFLTLFADGWFGLGLLAALTLSRAGGGRDAGSGAATWVLAAGLTLRTGAALATARGLGDGLRWLETVGGVAAAAAWLWLVAVLWRRGFGGDPTARAVARVALALVALKAVVELALALPAGEAFVARVGLHVTLLHAYLLGAVTLGLASFGRASLGPRAWRGLGAFAAGVAVMVALLLPLTGLWPRALGGLWTLRAAAYSSLGPALLGAYALLAGGRGGDDPAPGTAGRAVGRTHRGAAPRADRGPAPSAGAAARRR